jgi:hypothetical protein
VTELQHVPIVYQYGFASRAAVCRVFAEALIIGSQFQVWRLLIGHFQPSLGGYLIGGA